MQAGLPERLASPLTEREQLKQLRRKHEHSELKQRERAVSQRRQEMRELKAKVEQLQKKAKKVSWQLRGGRFGNVARNA